MIKPSSPADYIRLLNLLEDYFYDGFRRTRTPVKTENQQDVMDRIVYQVSGCKLCGLYENRKHTVPGEGNINPKLMLIGEGPGEKEDRTGKPFVGRAGQYLDKWLKAINLDRKLDCFIGNIVKCRPPGNRDPRPEESAACLPYLENQVDCLKPEVIVTLGRVASQILIGSTTGIGSLRGKWYTYRDIPLFPTYHPSAVLRNPSLRSTVWEDLKQVQKKLDHG